MEPLGLTPLEPGSEVVVAGYRVGELLRRHAAHDAVYAAVEVATDRAVELRVLSDREDQDRHARFLSDSALLAALHHPNLPDVLGSGEADEGLFLATAWLEGRQLAELARDGGLPPMHAVRLLGDVADALDSAHAEGLVHGDVSADNVIVVDRQTEQAYLVDFLLGSGRTATGPAAATPAGDVRGLASTLFEALTGRRPEAGAGGSHLRDHRQDIPQELDALVAAAMTSAPGRAGELIADAARSLLAGPPPASTPEPAESAAEPTAPAAEPAAAAPEPASPAAPPAWARPSEPAPPPAAAPPTVQPAPPLPAASPAEETGPAGGVPAWAAAPAPAVDDEPGPVRRAMSFKVPALAGLVLVLVAAAAGFFLGRPSDDAATNAASSASGFELTLPDGWEAAPGVGRIPGIPLDGPIAAGSRGAATLVAGRAAGLLGSVYPADLASRVDPRPPRPQAVRLTNAEALRFAGLDARGGSITLFVVPTSGGTLAAACAEGQAASACERAVSSLELGAATASSLSAGRRFAARLDATLATLERTRGAALRRLRSAATSSEQARAASDVQAAYRSARRSLGRVQAPPAAAAAQQRLQSELRDLERSYGRLAGAARRRAGAAFSSARRAALRSEARFRATLRRL